MYNANHIKPESIKELELMHMRHAKIMHPELRHIQYREYIDYTSNGLADCILAWMRLHGYSAQRIGPKLKRKDRNGAVNISCTVNGESVTVGLRAVEGHMTDRLRNVKRAVLASGGKYIFVHSFDDFLSQMKYGIFAKQKATIIENNIEKH